MLADIMQIIMLETTEATRVKMYEDYDYLGIAHTVCKIYSSVLQQVAIQLLSASLGCTRCKNSSKLGFNSFAQAFLFPKEEH